MYRVLSFGLFLVLCGLLWLNISMLPLSPLLPGLVWGGIVISILGGFLLDLVTPLGTVVWSLYLIPLLLTLWLPTLPHAWGVSGVIILLVILKPVLTSQGTPVAVYGFNRCAGVILICGLAWLIAQRKKRDLLLHTELGVSQILAESHTVEEAGRRLLQSICETVRWDIAGIWLVEEDQARLRCATMWQSPHLPASCLVTLSPDRTFAVGEGLPGRVWETGQAAWIAHIDRDSNFPRQSWAARDRMCSAFAFPIRDHDRVLGVMEFLSHSCRTPDMVLLDFMTDLGLRIGGFVLRRQAEMAQDRILTELRGALENVKTLQGLLPICSMCKKIRDEGGRWTELERYVQARTSAEFSHGICPMCLQQHYPKLYDQMQQRKDHPSS